MLNFDFSCRSEQSEIMDDLQFSDDIVFQTLRELDFINKWLGGNTITICGLSHVKKKYLKAGDHITIADLGCGSGSMLKMMVEWGRSNGIAVKAVGIDANPSIIDFARNQCSGYSEISFLNEDVFSETFSKRKFDVITSTLFFHHFNNKELEGLFMQLKEQCRLALVINDLHRHWVAYHSISMLTEAFSKSYMVKNDAKLSVARAFRKQDLINLISESGFPSFSIRWKWAFRYLLIAEK